MRLVLALLTVTVACTAPRDRGPDQDPAADAGRRDGPQMDAGLPMDASTPISDGGVVTKTPEIELIVGSFDGAQVVDERLDMAIGFPRHLDSAMVGLSALRLEDGTAVTLPIDSNVPLSRVIAATYDRAAERSLILAYPQTAPGDGNLGAQLELFSFDGARLRHLTSTNAPMVEGYAFSWLYPEGDGVHYRAFRSSAMSARATVQGESVTWDAEVELSQEGFFDPNQITHDPTGHRLLAFGEYVVEGVPPNFTERLVPHVFELILAGGTAWTKIPAFGDMPPELETEIGLFAYAIFFDDVGQRAVALLDHEVPNPFGDPEPWFVTGGWSLTHGQWEVISEDLGFCCAPWISGATDHVRRRSISLANGWPNAVDFTEGNEGNNVPLVASIAPSPRLLALERHGRQLIGMTRLGPATLDLDAQTPSWQPYFEAMVAPPGSSTDEPNFVFDASRDRFLAIGVDVHALENAAIGWQEIATTGPVHDGNLGAIAVRSGDAVYVAGGLHYEPNTGSPIPSSRLSRLDLPTMTWSTVANIGAEPRFAIMRDTTTIEVFFGVTGVSVDVVTGQTTPVQLTGDVPNVEEASVVAVDRAGKLVMLATDQQETVIFQETEAHVLSRTGSGRDPHSAWSNHGVHDPESGTAWFVGANTWRMTWN